MEGKMVRVPGEICWYVKKKKNDNLCRKTQLNRQKSAEVIVPKKKKKKKKKKWEGPNITARTGSDKFDERATKAENL